MELNETQWDIAEKELNTWLEEGKDDAALPLSNVLKSAYLAFRQKYAETFRLLLEKAEEKEKYKTKEEEGPTISTSISHNLDKVVDEKIHIHDFWADTSELQETTRDDFMPPHSYITLDELTKEANETVINRLLAGDQKTFNQLHAHSFPQVLRLVIKNSGTVEEAKDIFQDALVVLIEKLFGQKLQLTSSLSTYLYAVCHHLWKDQLRKNKREIPPEYFDEQLNQEITITGIDALPDIFESVSEAVNKLGQPCQQLLECFYYKRMDWDEIADSLGYASAASARNQKYKCLEKIRQTVGVKG